MALQILEKAFARVVLGAVEGHVLKEVGKTTLALFFEDRANFLGNEELGMMLGQIIVPNVVCEAVGQLAVNSIR